MIASLFAGLTGGPLDGLCLAAALDVAGHPDAPVNQALVALAQGCQQTTATVGQVADWALNLAQSAGVTVADWAGTLVRSTGLSV